MGRIKTPKLFYCTHRGVRGSNDQKAMYGSDGGVGRRTAPNLIYCSNRVGKNTAQSNFFESMAEWEEILL